MVRQEAFLVLLVAVAGAAAACQLIAGVQDKQLDTSLGAGGSDADVDASEEDHAIPDAPSDEAKDNVADVVEEEAGDPYARQPPPRPAGDAAPSDAGTEVTFAARSFYLGAIDPETDETTYEAWRKLGYDIDGKCTTAEQSVQDQSGVCGKPPGANQFAHEDGEECRDNIVGHELAEAIKLLSVDFERSLQAKSASGVVETLVIQLLDLDDGPDDPYVPAILYIAAPFESPPLWDGSDRPRIDSASVYDGGIDDPKYSYIGYMKENIWVSGDFRGPPSTLPLMVLDRVIEVPTISSTMTIVLNPTHTQASLSTFSAVLGGPELVAVMMPGLLELMGCNEVTANALFSSYFAKNRDLAAGSPNFVNPAVDCDVASIGVAVEWKAVRTPTELVYVPPKPSPCDAGAD